MELSIFGHMDLTFKVDIHFTSDLDLTHNMVLISINVIILLKLFRISALLIF